MQVQIDSETDEKMFRLLVGSSIARRIIGVNILYTSEVEENYRVASERR